MIKAALLLLPLLTCPASAADARLERVPEGGVQPQAVVQTDGTVHLVYLRGDPGGCDLRYTRRAGGAKTWEPPLTVNSVPRSAVAAGTIRGAQLAAGRDGRVHVVWNGAALGGDHAAAPLYYTRMEDGGKSFSPQRDLLGNTRHLDGGASIAATDSGGVFVVWHAAPSKEGMETDRLVYVRHSTDDGTTFTSATAVEGVAPGVCACCSLKALATPGGGLWILYRNVNASGGRDMTVLSSGTGGGVFQSRLLHPWPVQACPMSSAGLIPGTPTPRAVWETDGLIYTALPGSGSAPLAVSAKGARHPSAAVNSRGETLITWSTGTGWQRGGGLGWQILDAAGKPTGPRGGEKGVPVWSFPATFATPGGGFVILY